MTGRFTSGALLAGVLAVACASAACGTVSVVPSAPSGVLTIANANGAPWTCEFNPFTGAVGQLALGPVYEPLAFVNTLRDGKTTPWLATSWRWGAGNRALTFTIRKGVRFSDGTPMTAADVVFTFNLLKRYPNLDQNAVWPVLASVTQSGPDQVRMALRVADVPYFYYIATQVPIVPRRVWAAIRNPGAYRDSHPVGTGAFEVHACTKQEITYTANRRYWVPGEPHIAEVRYPAFMSNDAATTSLATGRAQWGSQFIPNAQAFYLSQSSSFHTWFPPVTNVSLLPNLKDPLLSDVKVRQAMAFAINRARVSRIAEYGYEPPANQAGVVTPTFSSWLNKKLLARYGYSYNPAKARQLLASSGFRMGRDGVMVNRAGQRLAFTIINTTGYTDWMAAVQVIQQDLGAVGIKVTPENLASSVVDARVSNGEFQLAYYDQAGGPSPYYELQQWLYSPFSAPVGQGAASDYERYTDSATDGLLNSYAAATSTAFQHQLVDRLEQVMLTDVPFIPVTEQVDWFEYDTAAFAGWPTPADPYAQPSVFVTPDWGQVLLHLTPKGTGP